ncbi:MAG: F0F1 ATP synthase subunit epsilon [Candidatus Cryptobacteroides sp.]|jgi:F0F1-type ATP synthase, epsilon subunit (mitochondrial delta subunit)
MMDIVLKIFSPEGMLVDAKVSGVEFPGTQGRFTVLRNHAPIISSLEKGEIFYTTEDGKKSLSVTSGFVKVNANEVSACVEI